MVNNAILKKIIYNNYILESPASPPMFTNATNETPMIPHANVSPWKLHLMDDLPVPNANIDPSILQVN